jgi:heme exporter protein B
VAERSRGVGHGRIGPMSPLRRSAAVALAIARKDALSELRGRQASGSTLFFAALVLLLFGFALGPDSRRLTEAAPGLLWLAIVFGGLLTVARLHQVEVEDGAMEQLALYPVDRRAIYAGKALAGAIAMLALGAVLLPVVAILYSIPIGASLLPLVITVALGAIGFAAVGTAYAGLTVRMRAREVMLPLLMLPIVAPLLLAAVKATTAALTGDPFGELGAWLQLLAGFDIVMLVAGAGTYGFLLEDS